MPINLNYLRNYVAVVEAGGFHMAAKVLHVSQPAVSKSIQNLEQEIGHLLIERSRRGIVLTEAGQLLLDYGRQMLKLEYEAEEALVELRGLERGHLALAASHTIATYVLPPLLAEFRQLYPGIHLSLEIGNTRRIAEILRAKPIDLAFVEGPIDEPEMEVTRWRRDRLVVIAPAAHPGANKGPIDIERITEWPYVQREIGSGTRYVVELALEERHIRLNVTIELGSNQAVKQAVIAGLGISIVSESTVALERSAGQLSVIEIVGESLERSFLAVSMRGHTTSRATSAFKALAGIPSG
jgi:DNA-binding transcriptional LysR family regulator